MSPVVEAMITLMTAVRPYAARGKDTIREILDRMPADHIARSMAARTCKCEACGAFQPLSQVQWSPEGAEPACERCDAVGQLTLVEDN